MLLNATKGDERTPSRFGVIEFFFTHEPLRFHFNVKADLVVDSFF
jgi:hypothetical protein